MHSGGLFLDEAELNHQGASTIPDDHDPDESYFKHLRIHPSLSARADYRLTPKWILSRALGYRQNWLEIRENTRLAEDMKAGAPRSDTCSVTTPLTAWSNIRWAPRGTAATGRSRRRAASIIPSGSTSRQAAQTPFRTGSGASTSLRACMRRSSNAGWCSPRGCFPNLLFGTPPFYELPRFDETSAIGGVNGVRGIPAQRYYGKIKIIANLELRSRVVDFMLFGKSTCGSIWLGPGTPIHSPFTWPLVTFSNALASALA